MPGITEQINVKSKPRWAGDWLSGREYLMPFPAKLDPTQFTNRMGTLVKVNNGAGYAAGVTSIVVDALLNPLPVGATLHFGGAKYATLSVAAVAGATTLTVLATPTALVDNDEAYWNPTSRKFVPSGTLVGRTLAEAGTNTAFGVAVDTDEEIYLTAFDVEDVNTYPYVELVRPYAGHVVKVNYLWDWTRIDADANLEADLRARYNCILGKD